MVEPIIYARFDEINEWSIFVYLFVCSWINEGNSIKQSEENLHMSKEEYRLFFLVSSSHQKKEEEEEEVKTAILL